MFDFVIETKATEEVLRQALTIVKPKGTVVLKSRNFAPVPLDFLAAVKKEVVFRATHYGSMGQAIELIADGKIEVDDLIGQSYSLEEYASALHDCMQREDTKPFFTIN